MPDDGTRFWEDIFKDQVNEVAEVSKELLAEIAPRPLGSQLVSLRDQAQEFQVMRDNPEVLFKFFQQQGASFEGAVKYIQRMKKALGE